MAHALQGQRLSEARRGSALGGSQCPSTEHGQCPQALCQHLHSPHCTCFQPDLTLLSRSQEMLVSTVSTSSSKKCNKRKGVFYSPYEDSPSIQLHASSPEHPRQCLAGSCSLGQDKTGPCTTQLWCVGKATAFPPKVTVP